MRHWVWLAFFAIGTVACSTERPTTLAVLIRAQPLMPAEIDQLDVHVSLDGDERFAQTYALPDDARLPGTITFTASDDVSSRVIDITASKSGTKRSIKRRARIGFVKGKSKLLRLTLEYSCFDVTCDQPDTTCIGGVCVSDTIDVGSLPDASTDEISSPGNEPGCFDEGKCFAGALPASISSTCTVSLGPLGVGNVGLVFASQPARVFLAQAGSDATIAGSIATLSPTLCAAAKAGTVAVVIEAMCPTASASQPVCAAPVTGHDAGGVGGGGHGGSPAGLGGAGGAAGVGGGGQAGTNGQAGAGGIGGGGMSGQGGAGGIGAGGISGSGGMSGAAGMSGAGGAAGIGGVSGAGGEGGGMSGGGSGGSAGSSGSGGQKPVTENILGFDAPVIAATMAGPTVTSVALADLDDDGLLDAIVASTGPSQITTFRGKGQGAFAAGKSMATMDPPSWLTITDFDRDGNLDVVVVSSSAFLTLYLGSPTGVLTASPTPIVIFGEGAQRAIAVDLDNVGFADIVTADTMTGNVSVMLSNEFSTSAATCKAGEPSTSPMMMTPVALATGDVDGDGVLDLLVGGVAGATFFPYNGTVYDLGHAVPETGNVVEVALRDMNRDTVDDYVALVDDGASGTLHIASVDGTTVVDLGMPVALAAGVHGLSIDDFDRDGILDAVVGDATSITVLANPTSAGAKKIISGPLTSFAVGDVDGDGKPDVVGVDGSGNLVVIRNTTPLCTDGVQNGDEPGVDCGGPCPKRCSVGAACFSDGDCQSGSCALTCQAAPASSLAAYTPVGSAGPAHVARLLAAPVRSGKLLDLIVSDPTGFHLALQGADKSFVAQGDIASDSLALATGDFDLDGHTDTVVVTSGSELVGYYGGGDGTFDVLGPIGPFSAGSIAATDLDGDGALDLVLESSGDTNVLRNRGHGYFTKMELTTFSPPLAPPVVFDVSGDHRPDLLLFEAGATTISLGLGNATFAPPAGTGAPAGIVARAVGDFDGDGRADLAVIDSSSRLSLGISNGSSLGFGGTLQLPAAPGPGLALADVDADGLLDAIMVTQDPPSIWVSNGTTGLKTLPVVSTPVSALTTCSAWTVADLDGDGRPEIALVGDGGMGPATLVVLTFIP